MIDAFYHIHSAGFGFYSVRSPPIFGVDGGPQPPRRLCLASLDRIEIKLAVGSKRRSLGLLEVVCGKYCSLWLNNILTIARAVG